jgi:hypothetical protein
MKSFEKNRFNARRTLRAASVWLLPVAVGAAAAAACGESEKACEDTQTCITTAGEGGEVGQGGGSGSAGRGGSSGSAGRGGSSGSAGRGGSSGSGSGATGGGGSGATSGDSGMSGAGGDSGAAGAGGGCDTGLTDCDGECFNLDQDGMHCGECDNACTTGLVCLNGNCETDCGALTQCGTSCVDTDTDEGHCGGCDRPCLGTCVDGNCDLSCPMGRVRCGAECCQPPVNGTATCETNMTCGGDCNTNYHDCGTTPVVCYADNDIRHCGTSCADCTQPNATSVCTDTDGNGSEECRNTCVGLTFACPGAGGKPACGTWDFESATVEGWYLSNTTPAANPLDDPSAATGSITTSTQHATSGNRSLAIAHDGNGQESFGLFVKIRLCPSGQALDLKGRTLTFDMFAETGSGSPAFTMADGHHYFISYNGNTEVTVQGDFDLGSDVLHTATYTFPTDDFTVTDIMFLFRVFTPWRGTLHMDNVRIQ